jgi:hypothetical protein
MLVQPSATPPSRADFIRPGRERVSVAAQAEAPTETYIPSGEKEPGLSLQSGMSSALEGAIPFHGFGSNLAFALEDTLERGRSDNLQILSLYGAIFNCSGTLALGAGLYLGHTTTWQAGAVLLAASGLAAGIAGAILGPGAPERRSTCSLS